MSNVQQNIQGKENILEFVKSNKKNSIWLLNINIKFKKFVFFHWITMIQKNKNIKNKKGERINSIDFYI